MDNGTKIYNEIVTIRGYYDKTRFITSYIVLIASGFFTVGSLLKHFNGIEFYKGLILVIILFFILGEIITSLVRSVYRDKLRDLQKEFDIVKCDQLQDIEDSRKKGENKK